jgi:hypothetical protein
MLLFITAQRAAIRATLRKRLERRLRSNRRYDSDRGRLSGRRSLSRETDAALTYSSRGPGTDVPTAATEYWLG